MLKINSNTHDEATPDLKNCRDFIFKHRDSASSINGQFFAGSDLITILLLFTLKKGISLRHYISCKKNYLNNFTDYVALSKKYFHFENRVGDLLNEP